MGDGNGHRGDGIDDDWSVELEVSREDLDAVTDAHPLVLERRELDALEAELDGAFTPLSTPPPGTRLPVRAAPSALSCPTCSGPVDVKSRHVAVSGGAVRVYCSQLCLDTRDAPRAEAMTGSVATPPPRRRRWIWWSAAAAFVGAGCATALYLTRELKELDERPLVPPAPALAVMHPVADPAQKITGDPQRDADEALTNELMHDAWIHPLAGPTRRMPVNHNGAFGAGRAGERPIECVSGHCGVDVGRVWGEHVYAVHDGVVDWVNRGPNDEHGGVFVKIAHRDGTLYSWYFHLAAVPRWVRPGVRVSAGQVIGLLGDTGIKHSAPHLHFALSVKTGKHNERYLDPEPLIAIWPLWLPNESGTGGTLATSEPGLPVRAAGGGGGGGGGKRRPPAKVSPATDEAAAPAIEIPSAATTASDATATATGAPH